MRRIKWWQRTFGWNRWQSLYLNEVVNKWYCVQNENSENDYSSSSCFKPVCVSFFCWTQKKIFRRMLMDPIDFYSICFPTIEVNCLVTKPNKWFGTTRGWVNDDGIALSYHFCLMVIKHMLIRMSWPYFAECTSINALSLK